MEPWSYLLHVAVLRQEREDKSAWRKAKAISQLGEQISTLDESGRIQSEGRGLISKPHGNSQLVNSR